MALLAVALLVAAPADARASGVDLSADEAGCEGGDAAACRRLSATYAKGEGVPKDVARAAEFAVKARREPTKKVCEHCDVCGGHHLDLAACAQFCEQSLGDPFACFLASQEFRSRGDLPSARKYAGLACKKDIGAGCSVLGSLCQLGQGGPKDVDEALRWMRRGAELHDPTALGYLGLLYVSGQQIPKDGTKGAQLLGESCALGYPPGCGYLGQAYENGAGVPHDEERAAVLYAKACNDSEAPYGQACFTVADRYDKGKWLKGDRAKALEFYKKGCAAGFRRACARLSELE